MTKQILKDYEGSIVDCNKAIELDPNFGKAYDNRAISKYNLNREYCLEFKKACELGICENYNISPCKQ